MQADRVAAEHGRLAVARDAIGPVGDARHFGVRQEDINLEPNRPPTVGEQLREVFTE
jgi:hypothetical protein